MARANGATGVGMEVVLGMDFGGTKIALAICGLDGRGLAQQVLVTNPGAGGDAVLERGISAGRALLALSGGHHDLVSVGVSTIGVPREDRVELAPAIPGWEHVGLAHTVTTAFGVPVRVVTDVKAAATAEARWGSLAGSDPAIYLNLGTGLAAAILVGGKVLDGAHGASGEIGYNVVAPGDAGCGIGARPMLEDTVSGMALAAPGSRALGRTVTAEQVFDAAPSDPELDAMVGALIDELSSHLAWIHRPVSPEGA